LGLFFLTKADGAAHAAAAVGGGVFDAAGGGIDGTEAVTDAARSLRAGYAQGDGSYRYGFYHQRAWDNDGGNYRLLD